MIAVVAIAVAGATGAFFSDTETSTGNTFTAGAIDLGVDNTSYYNGVLNTGTSWQLDWNISDEIPRQFFNFLDLKPGDWGEDTISLHVNNNDSYLCADVTLTSNDDKSSTEPELASLDALDDVSNLMDGELASHLRFVWWADDGDNVLETNETPIHNNVPLGTGSVALADSQTNVWGDLNGGLSGNGPLPGGVPRYIAKAWCFGDLTLAPVTAGAGQNPTVDGGVRCNGVNETNVTQTDGVTLDIAFRAVQSRNNTGFVCGQSQPEPHRLVLENENMTTSPDWTPITGDGIGGVLTWAGDGPTFSYSVSASGLPATTNYSLIYYADPYPGNNPGKLIGTGTTDSGGNLAFSDNPDLGMDLPMPTDANSGAPHNGAKIWLIPSANYNVGTNSVTPWTPDNTWLFEGNVYINYNDTNN